MVKWYSDVLTGPNGYSAPRTMHVIYRTGKVRKGNFSLEPRPIGHFYHRQGRKGLATHHTIFCATAR